MSHRSPDAIPTLLFGAFDRHNFGDLLLAHVAAALLEGKPLLFAGLLERDLRGYGGHRLRAVAALARELRDAPVNIIHVGGELLCCDSWQAAVMLLPPQQVQPVVARFEALPEQRLAWARDLLGVDGMAPYLLSRRLFPGAVSLICNAVGGVDLAAAAVALRAEVLEKLRMADRVSVRDRVTQAQLAAVGIAAPLTPDPAVMVAELFGARIAACGRQGEPARLLAEFPRGYIAVQFSADFGDDATLAVLAAQLDAVVRTTGHGVVLFRAGAAPWHDDLECYRRLAARMGSGAVRISAALDLWQICALIAQSRGYCGSSLHGRIVALAYGLPRINFLLPAHSGRPGKQAAFAAAWEVEQMAAVVEVEAIAAAMAGALAVAPGVLQEAAAGLAQRYRREFGRGG